jgi:hypothetical protein
LRSLGDNVGREGQCGVVGLDGHNL